MNPLTILNHNGVEVVDSREVAAAIDKRHDHLIRDISQYVNILEKAGVPKVAEINAPNFGEVNERNFAPVTAPNFGVSDFFIKSSYLDGKGETRPCYFLTRKGCDMVANKLTGEKGVLFTAAYVTAFERMHEQLATACVPISEVSLGSVASMIRIMRCIMLDAERSPQEVEQMAVGICNKWSVPLPPAMLVSPVTRQQLTFWEDAHA